MIAASRRAAHPTSPCPTRTASPSRCPTSPAAPVVLYFYPKADTPGLHHAGLRRPRPPPPTTRRPARSCSASRPTPSSAVKKFHDKQALNFTLLADEDHAVCEAYGVWVEKSMYGKTYWGAQRSTFVIDADGTVAT